MGIPQGDPITLPTTADVRDMESSSTEAQGAHNTTPSSFGCPSKDETPPAEPTTSPAKVDVKDTLPGPAETPPEEDAMVLLTESDTKTPRDLATSWATSPTKVETQVVPTTQSVVELVGPFTPSDQAEEERQHVLTVTTSMGRMNLEATGITPRGHGDCLSQESGLWEPQMVAALLGPTKGRKVVGHQDATIEELAEKDLAGDYL